MPAERCRICVDEFRATAVARPSERNYPSRAEFLLAYRAWEDYHRVRQQQQAQGVHHATGCRYSRCIDHCSCSTEEQTTWRAIIRSGSYNGYRCSDCGTDTNHLCQQYVEHTGEYLPVRTNRCGACCTNTGCATRVPCGTTSRYSRSGANRALPTEIVRCNNCLTARRIDESMMVNETRYCYSCARQPCGTCGTLNPSERRCDHCYRCTAYEGQAAVETVEPYDYANPPSDDADLPPTTRRVINNRTHHCACPDVSAPIQRPRLRFMQRVTFQFADNAPTANENPVARAVGVELEVAGFYNPTRHQLAALYNCTERWNAGIGTDASIRTEHGVEIRTAPAGGMHFVQQINEITHHLRRTQAFVTERCGMHVHVDCRGMLNAGRFEERYNAARRAELAQYGFRLPLDVLAYMYFMCEPVFYRMIPPARESGTYSKTWRAVIGGRYGVMTSNVSIQTIMADYQSAILQQGWYRSFVTVLRDGGRYMGMNPAAYGEHQTMEFRMHQGCVNPRRIKAWAIMLAKFVDICLTHSDPLKLVGFVRRNGPARFLYRIAPTADVRRMLRYHITRAELQDGRPRRRRARREAA